MGNLLRLANTIWGIYVVKIQVQMHHVSRFCLSLIFNEEREAREGWLWPTGLGGADLGLGGDCRSGLSPICTLHWYSTAFRALICAFSGSALRTHLLHWPGKVMLDSTRWCRPDKVATGCLFWKRPTLQNSKAAPRSQDLLVLQPTNSLPLFKLSKNTQQKAQQSDLKIE